MITKCLSDDGSLESSGADSFSDLESSNGSFRIKKFEIYDDFFFSDQDTAQDQVDLDSSENV